MAANEAFNAMSHGLRDSRDYLEKRIGERTEENTCRREVQVGEAWYIQKIHVLRELSRIRVYAMDITEQKRHEDELDRRSSELRQLSRQLRRVQEVERSTIAGELHDGAWAGAHGRKDQCKPSGERA